MTVRYSVTFEFPLRPPVTHRGTVTAREVHVCVGRATKAANVALQPREWSSMVCVLLERLDSAGSEGEANTTDEPKG
jgi:hypothetical protein